MISARRIAPSDLIAHCEGLGVYLYVSGGSLRFDAPKGVVDAELKAVLAAHKLALVEFIVGTVPPPDGFPASPPRPSDWSVLSEQRWGPALDDDGPGIVVDGPTHPMTPAGWRDEVAGWGQDRRDEWRKLAREGWVEMGRPTDPDEISAVGRWAYHLTRADADDLDGGLTS